MYSKKYIVIGNLYLISTFQFTVTQIVFFSTVGGEALYPIVSMKPYKNNVHH